MPRVGVWGSQVLNTANMTRVSINCSYLMSVPMPSFGCRNTFFWPLAGWAQDSAPINERTPSSCYNDWILGEYVLVQVR